MDKAVSVQLSLDENLHRHYTGLSSSTATTTTWCCCHNDGDDWRLCQCRSQEVVTGAMRWHRLWRNAPNLYSTRRRQRDCLVGTKREFLLSRPERGGHFGQPVYPVRKTSSDAFSNTYRTRGGARHYFSDLVDAVRGSRLGLERFNTTHTHTALQDLRCKDSCADAPV